jgi:hypothetical protein
MELLGDMGLVAQFRPFGDSVGVGVLVHGLRQTYHWLRNHFGHPIVLLDDVVHVESHFFQFGDRVSVSAR